MCSQQDFQEQKGLLEEEVLKRGHLVLFYPKSIVSATGLSISGGIQNGGQGSSVTTHGMG